MSNVSRGKERRKGLSGFSEWSLPGTAGPRRKPQLALAYEPAYDSVAIGMKRVPP